MGDMDLFLINDNLECWRLISCAVAKIFHLLKNFFLKMKPHTLFGTTTALS